MTPSIIMSRGVGATAFVARNSWLHAGTTHSRSTPLEDQAMLVLSRRVGERIVIGDDADIQITVVSIRGNHVRIGVTAPKSLRVDRLEIHQRIVAQNAHVHVDEAEPALAGAAT